MSQVITAVTMPKLGSNMTEGTIVEWHVAEGHPVELGDDLFTLETDKTTTSYEAPASGILKRRILGDGGTIGIGMLIGVIARAEVEEADVDEFIGAYRPEIVTV